MSPVNIGDSMNKDIRKVQRIGSSIYISLPRQFAEAGTYVLVQQIDQDNLTVKKIRF